MNKPPFNEAAVNADANRELIESGMIAAHQQLQGNALYYFSETQAIAHREHIEGGIHPSENPTGFRTAMDITTGQVICFTDIRVLEGNEPYIQFQQLPCGLSKTFSNKLPTVPQCADAEVIGKHNPANLLMLRTESGQLYRHIFDARVGGNGSLTGYYGKEKALEILGMIQKLPEDIRPIMRDDVNDRVLDITALIANGGNVAALAGFPRRSHDCRI